MKKIIIGLAGEIASGKDVTKEYLINNYGAGCYRFSTILRDILNRLRLPISRENMQDLSTMLRQHFGNDLLARTMAEDAKNDPHEIIVIDGIRRIEDMSHLKDLPGFILLAIEAKVETRYERLTKRQENIGEASKTFEQFLSAGQKEAEIAIPEVMAKADYRLDNNGSFTDLYRQIDAIITKLER